MAGAKSLISQDVRFSVQREPTTAAATGLRRLQQTWLPVHYSDRRVIGVVVPMVEAETGVRRSTGLPASSPAGSKKTIAVFATRYTVESKVFLLEATKRAPHLDIVQQACPRLVRLIESDAPVQAVRRTVRRYVELLLRRLGDRRLDAVLLGCTHYLLIADLFVEALPADVEVLSQPEVTACSLAAYLARHPEFACSHEPGVTFYTSAAPEHVTALTRRFLGDDSARSTLHVVSIRSRNRIHRPLSGVSCALATARSPPPGR